ncbi:MAG TPA: AAA family ATPase, partial [Halobacteriales archaeon]|nr:AAA family ATPase [Halobacteriales archaeon]
MADLGDFDDFAGGDDADDEASADAGADATGDGGTDSAAAPDSSASDFEPIDVETPSGDYGIGVLSAAEGLSVGEREDDTRLRAYVTVGNRSAVRVGTYLLVPYPDGETLFCRISGLSYAQEFHADDATEIHARRAMRSAGIDEQDYKFLADLEPVAILYSDGGELKRRMTDRVPKPETVVRRARDAGEIKTGLKIPGDGVFVGHLSVGGQKVRTAAEPPTIDYRIKDDYGTGDPLVFRHTLIAGGTGSGKTHAAKNVLRQYLAEERSYPVESG